MNQGSFLMRRIRHRHIYYYSLQLLLFTGITNVSYLLENNKRNIMLRDLDLWPRCRNNDNFYFVYNFEKFILATTRNCSGPPENERQTSFFSIRTTVYNIHNLGHSSQCHYVSLLSNPTLCDMRKISLSC